MTEEKIARINELAHKSKGPGLSEEEKAEQAELRKEFIADIRGSLKAQLDNIDIEQEDGTVINLGERHKTKGK